MIKSIRIRNFKSHLDTNEMEILPLTLLMGPNSSGKSAILQSLLLLRQTADSRDLERSLQTDGAYVSLGPYRDFVFNHNVRREINISLVLKPEKPVTWRAKRFEGKRVFRRLLEVIPDQIITDVTFGVGAPMQVSALKTAFIINDELLGNIVLRKERGARGAYSGIAQRNNESVTFMPQKKAKFYDMHQSAKALIKFASFIRASELDYNLTRLLTYVTSVFETAASNIVYIGPLRVEAERLYMAAGERPQDVGTAGEDTINVLLVGRREKKQVELRKKVNKWMSELGIAYELKLRQLGGPYFQLYLTDWHTGVKVNLTDVGFGASQLLPVIVEGYYAPSGSLIIAEQPEIHLHPKAQALLADLFIDIIKQDKKLLIETHSEHLLARVQRRIAEKEIDCNSIAIYYCQPSENGTEVRRIWLDEYGQLKPEGLPEAFFDESYRESKAHMEAIIKSKAESK